MWVYPVVTDRPDPGIYAAHSRLNLAVVAEVITENDCINERPTRSGVHPLRSSSMFEVTKVRSDSRSKCEKCKMSEKAYESSLKTNFVFNHFGIVLSPQSIILFSNSDKIAPHVPAL